MGGAASTALLSSLPCWLRGKMAAKQCGLPVLPVRRCAEHSAAAPHGCTRRRGVTDYPGKHGLLTFAFFVMDRNGLLLTAMLLSQQAIGPVFLCEKGSGRMAPATPEVSARQTSLFECVIDVQFF